MYCRPNVLRQKINAETKAVLTFIVRISEELAHCENLLMGIISKLCTTEAVEGHLNPGLFNPKLQPQTFQP